MEEDYDFTAGDAGSAGVEKVSAGSLKKGSLVLIKGHPCKVVDFSTAKVGKHGSAKAMVTGIDIFSSNKYECTFSTGENVDAPLLLRKEYQLINIDDEGYCTLMLETGETKEDLKLPDDEWLKDVKDKAKELFEQANVEILVTVISALGQEKIISVREGKEQ